MKIIPVAALCAALGLLGCEPEVEPEVCGSLTVISRDDVERARSCGEINGDLTLRGGVAELTALDFPNLTRINGSLIVTTFGSREPQLTGLTLGALQIIRGKLQIAANGTLRSAAFPSLTTLGSADTGNALEVFQAVLRRLDLSALTTVHGSVQIGDMSEFCSLNVQRLTRVSGRVQLQNLPNLPFSALSRLRSAASGGANVSDLGCCYTGDQSGCTLDWSSTCTGSACF
jgi:hypothetical protein